MKTKKESMTVSFLDYVNHAKTDDPDIRFILDRLPYFKKELLENVIEEMLKIEDGFKIIDQFDDAEKNCHIVFLEVVNNSISPRNGIKKAKMISHPQRVLFFGEKGLDYLVLKYPEKMIDHKVTSFESKHGSDKDYLHSFTMGENGRHLINRQTVKSSVISVGTIIAVFMTR